MEAGIPNIAGRIGTVHSREWTGPFYPYTYYSLDTSSGGWASGGVDMDASRCSSVYGSSKTVTPKSLKIAFYISY